MLKSELKEKNMTQVNLAELGRRMMAAATMVPVGDDIRFNAYCRIGDELTTIGQPFCKRSLREFSQEDLQVIRGFIAAQQLEVVR